MFTFFSIAAALAGAYLIYKLVKRLLKKSKDENSSFMDDMMKSYEDKVKDEVAKVSTNTEAIKSLRESIKNGETVSKPADGYGNESFRTPEKYEPINDLFQQIQKIVHDVSFSRTMMSVRQKIGEEKTPTNIPTGEIVIENMKSTNDINKAISSEMIKDDESFYGSIANNSLLIKQDVESTDVYEDKHIVPRRIIRILQDVSGSTKGDRVAWSLMMDYLLLRKSKRAHADFFITTFTNKIVAGAEATIVDPDSFETTYRFIDQNIRADGGTDINLAIVNELSKIESEKIDGVDNRDTQIVLITDGDESIDEKLIKQKLIDNNAVLHTVILGKDHQQLKNISKQYHFLDVPGINLKAF